jgi:hypothetical protein
MVRMQPNRFLTRLAVLFTAAVLAAGWCLHGSWRTAQAANLALAQKNRECRRLTTLDPPATAAQVAAIEADLARAEKSLAVLQEELKNATPGAFRTGAAGAPASRTDAFFDLTGFVKDMRAQAERAGVNLRAEEQFGFAAYAHEGPDPGLIAAVQRQRRAAAWLLEALFAARPRQLLSVRRAPAAGITPDPSPARPPGGAAATSDADVFEIDPRLSIRTLDVEDATAFRLTFTGYSATLRRFLNRLATGDLFVVVRSVAVEPVVSHPPPRKASPGGPEPLVETVGPALSRFAVTVESCKLVGPPAPAGRACHAASGQPGPQGAPRCWVEPAAQRRGPGWIYDLFTPPAVHYDQLSRTLTATPAPELVPADTDENPPDLELLEVRREPFRLQLVGYAGGPGELRGIFLDMRRGETAIGRAGDHLAGSGLSVKRLAVTGGGGFQSGAETGEPMAEATVADEATGNEVVLTSRGRCWSGTLLALVASRRTPGFRRELREGGLFALDGASYYVKRIDADPPLVVIADLANAGAVSAIHVLGPPHAPAAVAPALTAAGPSIENLSSTP